jgi:hypothetical protein
MPYCLPGNHDDLVAVPSLFRDRHCGSRLLHCTQSGQRWGNLSYKPPNLSRKIFAPPQIFPVAPQRNFTHIVAARHREVLLRDAAALPGRFLPELGRSFGSGLFYSAACAKQQKGPSD